MKKLILFLSIFTFLTSMLYAQGQKEKYFGLPFFTNDFTFGYAFPLGDLTGNNIGEYYALKNYGTKKGFFAQWNLKFGAVNFKTSQIRPYVSISYSQFSASEDRAYNMIPAPIGWPGTQYYQPLKDTTGESYIRVNNPYVAIGIEFAYFTDRKKASIISVGTDFNINVLFGRVYDKVASKQELHNNLLDATRFGLGFNLQYCYKFEKWLGYSVGVRYQLPNLFGPRKSDAVKDIADIPFNDDSSPTLNPLLQKKTLGYIGIYAGVNFFIGSMK
ncbi:MAG: hypothetical protein ACP5P3_04785 [Ignavibacteria bacterium]